MNLKAYVSAERGRAAKLAESLGVTPVTVHEWVHGEIPVAAVRCIEIERATDGAVTCEELRPDLAEHWQFIRGRRRKAAA